MNENVTITGGTLKDDMFCHYSYSKEVAEGITDKVNWKSQLPIHDDMKSAYRKLNPHLAVICEEVHNLEITDIEAVPVRPTDQPYEEWEKSLKDIDKKLYAFVVSGIQFQGTGENEGVILIGKKKLSTGDWVELVTPCIVWDDTSYFFVNELRIAADDIAKEIKLYMEGKQAPRIIQTAMDFPEEENRPKKKKGNVSVTMEFDGNKVEMGSLEEFEDRSKKAIEKIKSGRKGSKNNPVPIEE